MKDLVTIQSNQIVTTSLVVSDYFDKKHKHVLEAIDSLLNNPQDGTHEMFKEETYKHPQNHQDYRMFYMNRDGWMLLVMGFNGKKAKELKIEFIRAFNEMGKQIAAQNDNFTLPSTYADALESLLQEVRRNEVLETQNAVLSSENNAITSNDALFTAYDIAKTFKNCSAIKINRILKSKKIIFHKGGAYHLYKDYQDKGYARSVGYANSSLKDLRWTSKGRIFVHSILLDCGFEEIDEPMRQQSLFKQG